MPHVRELIPPEIDDILNAVKNKNIEYFSNWQLLVEPDKANYWG